MAIIEQFSDVDGDHHKAWVIDQIARAPLGDGYEPWLAAYRAGADGPETYAWDIGVAP